SNGDGKLNVLLSRYLNAGDAGTQLDVLANDGTGSFTLGGGQIMPQLSSGTMVSLDLNGDRYVDQAVVDGPNNRVDLFINNGDGTFKSPIFLATVGDPNLIAAGDLNGDSSLDLVVTNNATGDISVFLNDGFGGFGTAATAASGLTGPQSIALGHFDNNTSD